MVVYMKLIIVESPTKAKHIREMLGAEYLVLASFGHVRDLPPKKLGVDIENGFKTQYLQVKKKINPMPQIKKAAAEAQEIFLAADPDREGEAIAWHIEQLLPVKDRKKCRRVVFKEITQSGVLKGLEEPRNIDNDLVNAQQARRVLDRLTGFKISPILWKSIKGKTGLSAGRVQSAALKLLFDRAQEIRNFHKETFYNIYGNFETEQGVIELKLTELNGKKVDRFEEKEAKKACQAIKGGRFKIKSIDKKPVAQNPPQPFETTTMLQEAGRLLGFSAEKTMGVSQELFEMGLITYIRTDSTRISNEAQLEAAVYIRKNFGTEYLAKAEEIHVKEGTQDAHEAIRPTSLMQLEKQEKNLTKEQFKLYSMIYKRFIASQMAPARYEEYTIGVEGTNERKAMLFINQETIATFSGTHRFIIFPGYQAIYQEENKAAAEGKGFIKCLKSSTQISEKDIYTVQKETKPPQPYTETALIKKLDQLGIGRPSTYSAIIKILVTKEYVKRTSNKFAITPLGEEVIGVLQSYFPRILDYSFTAILELELDLIACNQEQYQPVVGRYYKEIEKATKALRH